jgi:hypothetical protein
MGCGCKSAPKCCPIPQWLLSPRQAYAVIASDTQELQYPTVALFVGVGGTLKVTLADGDVLTTTVESGTTFRFSVKQVWSTGTSATSILGIPDH